MAKTLRDCQALFGYDAVVVFPDLTLGAEALGCTLEWRDDGPPAVAEGLASFDALDALPAGSMAARGRMPAALDAAGQLVETIGRGCAVLGAVTGPVTLARLAFPSAVLFSKERTAPRVIERLAAENLAVARAFFERRVDGVIVLDPDLSEAPPAVHDALTKAFRTLHNLAQFYDGRLLLAAHGPAPIAASLNADGVSLSGQDVETQVAGTKRGQARGALISADAWSDNVEEDRPRHRRRGRRQPLPHHRRRGPLPTPPPTPSTTSWTPSKGNQAARASSLDWMYRFMIHSVCLIAPWPRTTNADCGDRGTVPLRNQHKREGLRATPCARLGRE